jgi:predicted Zn-dependent protease
MRRFSSLATVVVVLMATSEPAHVQSAAGGVLLNVMQAELQRNLAALRDAPDPAYFVGYTVHDTRLARLAASGGSLLRSDVSHNRAASVEVRVGDYAFDNTHPLRGDFNAGPRITRVNLALTDDETAIRQELWRGTDRAYKQAAEALTRARTNAAAKIQQDDPSPDFSREDVHVHTGSPAAFTLDTAAWEDRLRRLSAPFADDPRIFSSDVSLTVEATNRYIANSEGSRIATGELFCRIMIQATTKAADGMELPLHSSFFARQPAALPSEAALAAEVRSMMTLLARLREAPIVDPFSGPAILSGRAAGVFFHEIFGHRVEGHRQRSDDDAQTFAKRVGQPVLPTFLSVIFDPTRRLRGETELHGFYEFDDEGVKARPVTVVDKGTLQTFLLGRAPIRQFPRSNGHGRAQPGYVPVSRQSNLIVESAQSVSPERLVEMLKEEARRQGTPFGLLFDTIEGGFTFTGRSTPNAFNVLPNVVYRVYADGRPTELVRGVDLIGTPLAAFSKILAASDAVDVFNGLCGAESGNVPVSASSPSLLVSEVEVQKKAQSQETLPILPAPAPRRKS